MRRLKVGDPMLPAAVSRAEQPILTKLMINRFWEDLCTSNGQANYHRAVYPVCAACPYHPDPLSSLVFHALQLSWSEGRPLAVSLQYL